MLIVSASEALLKLKRQIKKKLNLNVTYRIEFFYI